MFPLLPREMKHLFDRGDGGRHDWMRFHAHDVNCPLNCHGVLLWKEKGKLLSCDQCGAEFKATLVAKNKEVLT